MDNQSEIDLIQSQMNAIYDPDRDYEISFYDLDFEDREAYTELRMRRNALLVN